MARVYWITGLSGSGKTTIGKIFYEELKKENPAVVFLDGDTLRQVFGNDFGYSEADRRRCAMRYSRLCRLFSEQGITVVICTISMFEGVRAWNRENLPDYKEIYVKVSMDTLYRRNQKGLYSSDTAEAGKEVVGIQISFEEPRRPDLVLVNDGERTPQEQAQRMIKCFLDGSRTKTEIMQTEEDYD